MGYPVVDEEKMSDVKSAWIPALRMFFRWKTATKVVNPDECVWTAKVAWKSAKKKPSNWSRVDIHRRTFLLPGLPGD